MAFKSLDQVFDPTLRLPGPNGKTYIVPEGDAEVGLWCVRAFMVITDAAEGKTPPEGAEPPQLRFEGPEETAFQRRILGEALYAELIADGAGKATIDFITKTAVIWHAVGEEVAEIYWNAGGNPVDFLPAANRAAKRAARSGTSTSSTATGAASTTKRAGSGSGTTSRARSKRA